MALNSIAAIPQTDIHEFYEPAHANSLLDNNQKIHLLEAFSLIRCQSARDALLNLVRRMRK